MLRQRVITALILVPLALALLFVANPAGFALGIAPLIGVAATEWCRLAGLQRLPQLGYLLIIALLMGLLYYFPVLNNLLLPLALCWWLWAAWVLLGFPDRQPQGFFGVPGMLLAGPLLLVVPWFALYTLRGQAGGEWLVLFLFLLIWGADIGAYFAGRRWGRHKLLPRVSPGKTWEGVIGGTLAALVIALLAALLKGRTGLDIGYFLLVALAVSWVSVIGDLVESQFKRCAGVKDSGKLLPGHGGVLDRIDSLTIAAPLFGLMMIGQW